MQTTTPSSMMASLSPSATNPKDDTKVIHDLASVSEQIKLCTSMLLQTINEQHSSSSSSFSTAIDSNTSLLTIIGFLEACVPRMVDLIQAGTQGGFAREETLLRTLEVNDDLCKVLKDVDDPSGLLSLLEQERKVAASSAVGGGVEGSGLQAGFDAFGIGGDGGMSPSVLADPRSQSSGQKVGIQPSGLEDLLASPKDTSTTFSALDDLLTLSSSNAGADGSSASGAVPAGGAQKDDEFDDFFGERMGGKIS